MTGFVENYLLYLLAAASEKASAEFHAQARAFGVRVPEWRVLACLTDQDGAMITRLADIALVEQSRLTRIIDGMVQKGWVTRKPDNRDKRRVRVHLTDGGRDLADKLIFAARQHEAALLGALGSPDAERIKGALTGLLTRLNDPEA